MKLIGFNGIDFTKHKLGYEIISKTKIDPNKDLTVEINNILKVYIISVMKPLENSEFFKKREKKSHGKPWDL